eukprot:1184140-Prorocentrum_minimum.AAC.2
MPTREGGWEAEHASEEAEEEERKKRKRRKKMAAMELAEVQEGAEGGGRSEETSAALANMHERAQADSLKASLGGDYRKN